MSRVALYARYSSDRQRTASIEDQLRLCRDHATARGWKIVSTYTNEAASGASLNGRPGMLAMLSAARDGRFDIVAAEALDRLSRDQEDIARLFKMFRFAGIGLSTVAEGQIDELHIGLKGTMNALFLNDLANKTAGDCGVGSSRVVRVAVSATAMTCGSTPTGKSVAGSSMRRRRISSAVS